MLGSVAVESKAGICIFDLHGSEEPRHDGSFRSCVFISRERAERHESSDVPSVPLHCDCAESLTGQTQQIF